LSQQLNLGGLAGARRDALAAEVDLAAATHVAARVDRRLAVARAWLEAWAARSIHAATEAEVQAARDLADKLARLGAEGAVTSVDIANARAFAAEAAALHLAWEGREFDAEAHLALLLGLPDVRAVAPEAPHLEHPALSRATAEALPELRRRRAEAEAATRRVAETRAQYATQLQLSVQGGHEAPTQWFANAGVGVTLPVFERGQRDVAMAASEAARLAGALHAEEAAARVFLQQLAHELSHAQEVFDVVAGQQLPAASEAVRLEARRFEAGEATLLELLQVRRLGLSARIAAIEAEADLLAARARAREVLSVGGAR
jgi:cobalt-zinc-cadmium efflux system outer membrane protein